MAYVEVADVKVYYELEGSGQDVILLHGWGQNVEMMRPIFEHLKGRFRVCNLDLPGFGKSEEPPTVWGPYEYSEMVEELIAQLGLKNPKLIGHSYGGRIAIVYASRHLECEQIVLCDAAGIKPRRKIDYYAKVYTYKLGKWIKQMLGLKIESKAGSSDYQQASPMMKAVLVKSVNLDLTPLLKQIKASTLIIWGEVDDTTPLWMAHVMEREIADAGLVVFNGAGHFAYYEQMRRFLTILDAFVKGDD